MTKTNRFLALGMFLLMSAWGCGGGTPGASDSSEGSSNGPPVDFFGELSVDVGEVIAGTWTVRGYETWASPDENASFESTLTFSSDGSITGEPNYPIFYSSPITPQSYAVPSAATTECSQFFVPDGVVGATAYGNSYYFESLDPSLLLLLNPSMTYEVVETEFNPIIKFSLGGKSFRTCCVPIDAGGGGAALTVAEACPDYSNELLDWGPSVKGFTVIGAKENAIAFMTDWDLLIVMTRVE